MDSDATRDRLQQSLVTLAERRRDLQAEADRLGLDIGALVRRLRDEFGVSRAQSAREVHLSPAMLTELMKSAEARGIEVPGSDRLPILDGADLVTFTKRHGGLRRILTSAQRWPLLFRTALDPSSFRNGQHLSYPWLVAQCHDDEWVGFSDRYYSVGYNGSGPSNTLYALQRLGVDSETSHEIAYRNSSDAALDAPGGVWEFGEGDAVPPTPVEADGPIYVAQVPVRPAFGDDSPPDQVLREWLSYLGRPDLPVWMRGTRRVRVWLEPEAADAAGYGRHAARYSREIQEVSVIVEQGSLQLWLDVPASADPTMIYSPEMREVVEHLGFYEEMSEARRLEGRNKFLRWLRTYDADRTAFVDLGGRQPRYLRSGPGTTSAPS
jgi:hypothetical protein